MMFNIREVSLLVLIPSVIVTHSFLFDLVVSHLPFINFIPLSNPDTLVSPVSRFIFNLRSRL